MRLIGAHWKPLLVAVVALAAVIAASITLVRFHNRDRGVTQAVLWAVDDLSAVPDSVIAGVYSVDAYRAATGRLADALRATPVDSIRAFYQAYALWARDGIITTDELRAAGPYLGLTPLPPAVPPDTAVGSTEGNVIP